MLHQQEINIKSSKNNDDGLFCKYWQLVRAHQLPFSSSHTRVATLFSLLYIDLWIDHKSATTIQKYCVSNVDDHT